MILNGTTYNDDTPMRVARILEQCRADGTRIRIHYGDRKTGRDWLDKYGVTGRVGRSTGPSKVPLLIANTHSHGGPWMLDHCIVRIRYSNKRKGGDLYRHENYHKGTES